MEAVAAGAEAASASFSDGDYKECLRSLDGISRALTAGDAKAPTDFRVLHNTALTTFALGGCSNTTQLLREISTVDRFISSGEGGSQNGGRPSARDRLVLLLNQATLLFGHERFAHAGQILESMFPSINEADEGVALRTTLLLLEVYLHTYKAAAAGDSVTRSVISSANRVLRFLQAPHTFNDATALVAAVEAVRVAHKSNTTESSSSSSSSSSASSPSSGSKAGGQEDDEESVALPLEEGALTSMAVLRRASPRRVAAALCGRFFFVLHEVKARFALAGGDTATAASELQAAVLAWRTQVLGSGATEDEGEEKRQGGTHSLLRSDGLDACPRTLPRMEGTVEDPDVDAGGTGSLPLDLRAHMLHHRSRLLAAQGMTTAAVVLLDAAREASMALGLPASATGAGAASGKTDTSKASSSNKRGGSGSSSSSSAAAKRLAAPEWPLPAQVCTRERHLNDLALLHAQSGRLHAAAALLHRAVAACGDTEAGIVRSIALGEAAKTDVGRVTDSEAGSSTPALDAIRVGPAGSAALGWGLCPRLLPPRREILLNAGIVALLRRRPLEAFAHLRRAVMLFRQRPRLWVRLAEACILYHEQCRSLTVSGSPSARLGGSWLAGPMSAAVSEPIVSLPQDDSDSSSSSSVAASARSRERDICWAGAGVVRAVFGDGASQRLLLTTPPVVCPEPAMEDQRRMAQRAATGATDSDDDDDDDDDAHASSGSSSGAGSASASAPQEPAAPSLQYARACLENALCLLPTSTAVAVQPPALFGTVADTADDAAAALGSAPRDSDAAARAGAAAEAAVHAALRGWRQTRAAALTKLAYVCLALDDPVAALRYGNQMATEPRPSAEDDQKPFLEAWYLSRLYAAEALCRLDRPADAVEVLTRTGPAPAPTSAAAASSSRAQGQSALNVNLAIAATLAGRPTEAAQAVKAVLAANPLAAEARAVSALLTQQMGRPTDTRDLLSHGIAPTAVGSGMGQRGSE